MLISIDHGNKQIKTNRRTFVAGLHESDTRPPFGQNILHYNGKYYTSCTTTANITPYPSSVFRI